MDKKVKRLLSIGIALLVIMSWMIIRFYHADITWTVFKPTIEHTVRYTMDGDSIQSSDGTTIRLYAIDAPELKQSCYTNDEQWECGRESRQKLQTFIKNKRITCKLIEKDKYNRNVEDCSVDNKSINEYMVENGWAVAYTRYSDKYLPDERKAKRNKLGIWSANCFIKPEKWRRGERCPQ